MFFPRSNSISTLLLLLLSSKATNAIEELRFANLRGEGPATVTEKDVSIVSDANQRSNNKGSTGFHPIYIFSNQEIANQEVPDRASVSGRHTQPYSQAYQDRAILALTKAHDEKEHLPEGRHKFFVDLASNDAIILTNTLHLEQNGWDGICIEGNPEYWYKLGRYRKCTIIGAFVGGKPEEDGKVVDIALRGATGGIIGEGTDNENNDNKANVYVKRELVSIYRVFKEFHVPDVIDYFSLDVEGAESLVMADFPWDQYKFRFLTIERPKDDLKFLLEKNGYSMIAYLADWGETLWVNQNYTNLTIEEMHQSISQWTRKRIIPVRR